MFVIVLLPFAVVLIIGIMWRVTGKAWKAKQNTFPKPEDHRPGRFG